MTLTSSRRDTTALLTGVSLIVLPLVGAAFKILWPGWMLVIILFVSPVLLIGYGLQVAIAASGFLSARAVLRDGERRRPALWAAWLTAIGVVVVGLFFGDGGDSSWGSAFMYIVGAESDDGVAAVSSVLAWVGAIAWIGGWIWLVVEWIRALIRRRRG
ncbi:hypothetical protein [Microbacterium caowuchunii]|uniref:Uncharacterized protein n=1 Tax=Microbacterium caowuchunii TaxID=2614638 RepID=A0A5N0TA56_9MICO|nr:hypothetical protein [Microbacterium caowuchunii]KAA9130716.1 hypothetical protein F6B40_13910 [Microbacterium caowuchunii]